MHKTFRSQECKYIDGGVSVHHMAEENIYFSCPILKKQVYFDEEGYAFLGGKNRTLRLAHIVRFGRQVCLPIEAPRHGKVDPRDPKCLVAGKRQKEASATTTPE